MAEPLNLPCTPSPSIPSFLLSALRQSPGTHSLLSFVLLPRATSLAMLHNAGGQRVACGRSMSTRAPKLIFRPSHIRSVTTWVYSNAQAGETCKMRSIAASSRFASSQAGRRAHLGPIAHRPTPQV